LVILVSNRKDWIVGISGLNVARSYLNLLLVRLADSLKAVVDTAFRTAIFIGAHAVFKVLKGVNLLTNEGDQAKAVHYEFIVEGRSVLLDYRHVNRQSGYL